MEAMHATHVPDVLRGVPMESLRTFEAAARTLNFSRAAGDLHLTQSAVSRGIRTLEHRLGAPLFERRRPHLALTPAGESFAREVARALDHLRDAVHRVQANAAQASLVVRVPRGFAVGWLFTRVANFVSEHPDIDVRLSLAQRVGTEGDRATTDEAYMAGADLGIRLLPRSEGEGRYFRLLDEYIHPCCAPGLVPRHATHVSDLLTLPILEYDDGLVPLEGNWSVWSALVGVDPPLHSAQWLRVSDWQALFELAARGKGLCLGRTPMVSEHLRAGSLVAPAAQVLHGPRAYYVIESDHGRRQRLQEFAAWLSAEAEQQCAFESQFMKGRQLVDADELRHA